MATPSNSLTPPTAGGPPPGGPPPMGGAGASAGGPPGGGAPQSLARLAMDAQKIASESPETAPMMREIQNQVRMATMKMIQQRQATKQATPAI